MEYERNKDSKKKKMFFRQGLGDEIFWVFFMPESNPPIGLWKTYLYTYEYVICIFDIIFWSCSNFKETSQTIGEKHLFKGNFFYCRMDL